MPKFDIPPEKAKQFITDLKNKSLPSNKFGKVEHDNGKFYTFLEVTLPKEFYEQGRSFKYTVFALPDLIEGEVTKTVTISIFFGFGFDDPFEYGVLLNNYMSGFDKLLDSILETKNLGVCKKMKPGVKFAFVCNYDQETLDTIKEVREVVRVIELKDRKRLSPNRAIN